MSTVVPRFKCVIIRRASLCGTQVALIVGAVWNSLGHYLLRTLSGLFGTVWGSTFANIVGA
eukprot:1183867-Alexandrium_andersonii.AAC.1